MSRAFALVTGTTAGLGESVARQLLARGWHVYGVARRKATLAQQTYDHASLDLSNLDTLESELTGRLTEVIASREWTRIALVNNAAIVGHLGWMTALDPIDHARLYAVNVVAPVWLMGLFVKMVPNATTLRIVNVTSGAAVRAFPGLGAYSMSKAALRMASMMMSAELEAARGTKRERRDTAILTYAPGIVETDMQRTARERPPEEFPSQGMFQGFLESGVIVPPDVPAAEIVRFCESKSPPMYAEERLAG